jgi:hypothetical protein
MTGMETMMVVLLMEVLGLIGIILKKEENSRSYVADLGATTLGIAALRAAATSTSTTTSVFVLPFLFRILLSLLIFFPLSPQIKSPSGDPIFWDLGVLSFVKLGDGVLWVRV